MITGEFVALVHGVACEERASDDDVVVGMRWELGDVVVDRSIGLCDGDSEKQQSPRARIHGGSPNPALGNPNPFLRCASLTKSRNFETTGPNKTRL